nr:MtrAB system response regulator MtrA [Propionicicella superfundia]
MNDPSGVRPRILVVDDDPRVSEMLQLVLQQEGFSTAWCATGTDALRSFREFHADLVLLDVMLPGLSGVEVCREIRAESGVPIVMLTAKSDTSDIVEGLTAGADDYVSKPFKSKELVARVRARLRRLSSDQHFVRIGDLVIDVIGHEVKRRDHVINLTPLEFDLLLALARRPRHAFTREGLLEEVWGYQHAADTRLVNVHVQRLRSKIERDPEHPEIVVTVRGVGYRAGDVSLA